MPDVFKVKNKEEFPHDKMHSNYLLYMPEKKDKGLLEK